MMRFALLGSGSKGNATLVEAGDTRVMVDCGFTIADTERRLSRLDIAPDSLNAILVTHEHSDHLRGVIPFAQRHEIPVWMTAGTLQDADIPAELDVQVIDPHKVLKIGALAIEPYVVPHDAREPCQFVFSDNINSIAQLTDAGSITPRIREALSCCDALLLEFNHEVELLRASAYPAWLQDRIAGDWGHLSNQQACDLLASLDRSHLQHIVALHISEKNNTPGHVRQQLAILDVTMPDRVEFADQQDGLEWREVI